MDAMCIGRRAFGAPGVEDWAGAIDDRVYGARAASINVVLRCMMLTFWLRGVVNKPPRPRGSYRVRRRTKHRWEGAAHPYTEATRGRWEESRPGREIDPDDRRATLMPAALASTPRRPAV